MSRPTAAVRAAEIERRLMTLGDRRRAEGSKAYLKSKLVFAGLDAPTLRREVRALHRNDPSLSGRPLRALARALWRRPLFELRAFAVELLTLHVDELSSADLPMLERFLRQSKTWALVDAIAPRLVGPIHERDPRACGPLLDRWADDDDFWLRRASLLTLLVPLRRGGGDWPRFARYADSMLESREFFLRKAIGWVLREVAKQRPALVVEFLSPRLGRVAPLTLREATKYLPAPARERLRTAST